MKPRTKVQLLLALLCLVLTMCRCGGSLRVTHQPNPEARTLRQPCYVDSEFTKEERAEIQLAIDAWNHTLNGATFYYVADWDWKPVALMDDESTILNEREGMKFIRQRMSDPDVGEEIGHVPDLGDEHVFLVADRIAGCCDLRSVAAHEMGHAMGLKHNMFKGSVMYPYYTNQGTPEDGRCIDEITARELAENEPERYPLSHLNYCRLPQ